MYRVGGRTQGTETSKYLEEWKATATPSVAASERGPAQTGVHLTVCVAYVHLGLWDRLVDAQVGRELQSRRLVEALWKGVP